MSKKFLHQVYRLSHAPGHRRFVRALGNVEGVQRAKLGGYLAAAAQTEAGRALGVDATWSYERFAEEIPVSDYSHWSTWVDRQRERPGQAVIAERCLRYEPTSGSTSRRKWIPFTRALMREFDAAASGWISDLARRHPAVGGGRHYWSMSWLPDDLRAEMSGTDDVRVFPNWKRKIINTIMAVPCEVGRLATSEDSMFATLAYLAACEELTVMSVWSPTFALNLFEGLALERERIAGILETGRWELPLRAPRSARAGRLLREWDGRVSPEFLATLWPRLRLVSAWDSSTSESWAQELRRLLPQAEFQGKGLWATECVVTIPFRGEYPLALTSHFLEFRCLDTGKIFPAWQLKAGQRLQPIVTTGSGFLRYELQDEVLVTGFLGRCPTLRFIGRLGGVDLVGEKMDRSAAADVLKRMSLELELPCVTLVAQRPAQAAPRYVLLAQGDLRRGGAAPQAQLERSLLEFHHYRLARELGQLAHAELLVRPDAVALYHRLCGAGESVIAGNVKLEPVMLHHGAILE